MEFHFLYSSPYLSLSLCLSLFVASNGALRWLSQRVANNYNDNLKLNKLYSLISANQRGENTKNKKP